MKKLIALLLVLVVSLTLAACKKDNKYNTNTPYGQLSDATYASVGDVKLTEKQLYDQLRANGYTYLTDMIVEKLIGNANLKITDEETRDELIEKINTACYGTTEIDDLTESARKTAEKKYVDTMFLKGVKVEENNIYTDEALNYYLSDLAKEKYALSVLKDENSKYYYKNEEYTENEETVANPYYVSEEDVEAKYEANFNEDATYSVVIIGFPTYAEAQKALEGVTITTGAELKDVYKNVYHFKEASFTLTDKDLSTYNSSLVSLISKMKSNTYRLYQEFDKTIYHIYLETEKPESNFEALTAEEKAEIELEVLKDKAASFKTTAINEVLLNADVTIYDPAYDALFANDNENHERLLASDWKAEYANNVAKVGETYITVSELYNKLEKELGYSTAADYLTTKLILTSSYAEKLTAEDSKKATEEYEKAMKSFKNNEYASYGYPSTMDENIFKLLYFGNTDETEIINGYKAQKLWEYKIADKPESYYDALVKFGKKYIERYFDLSVKHVLLFVDYDSDGTPDDPELFMKKLSATDKVLFEQKIEKLFNLFVAEANYLVEKDWASLVDALTYVQKQYYSNGLVYHTENNETDTWADYKENALGQNEGSFGIGITVEDLSNVNISNASNYVPEFGEGVQKLYNKLVAEKIIENNVLDEDYLPTTVVEKDQEGKVTYDHIITTTYGYHILGVYNCKNFTDAEYTSENDRSEQYVDIKIKLNDEDITIENAYSEDKYASLNQIKIYAAQVGSKDGVTDLPSDVETFISYFYSTIKSNYENTTFQNILFAKTDLKTITFTNTENNAKFAEYLNIQLRQLNSYKENDDTYLANWWDEFLPAQ